VHPGQGKADAEITLEQFGNASSVVALRALRLLQYGGAGFELRPFLSHLQASKVTARNPR